MASTTTKSFSRFLVIDDDTLVAETIVESLMLMDQTALYAHTITKARLMVNNEKFTCIVCDFNFGQINSGELIKYIKNKSEYNKETPVVLISGQIDGEAIKDIAPYLDGAIIKPFNIDTLINKLSTLKKLKHLKFAVEA